MGVLAGCDIHAQMGRTVGMTHQVGKRGLPVVLLLLAVAVIMILDGAVTTGFALGLIVAGAAGLLVVAMVLYEVAHGEHRRPRGGRPYRTPQARGS
jgi:hypothetical protein